MSDFDEGEWLDDQDWDTDYRQCKLRKALPDAFREQTAYLPIQYCRKGLGVRLRGPDGKWDEGWVVIEVYPWPVKGRDLPDRIL